MVVLSTEAASHLSQCHWQKRCQCVMKYKSFLNSYKILRKFPYTNLIPPSSPFLLIWFHVPSWDISESSKHLGLIPDVGFLSDVFT